VKVRVEMKDGTLYEGIKGGSEGGLLYLFDPVSLEEDQTGEFDGYMSTNLVDITKNGGHIMIPISDIKVIVNEGQ
jgi:hypothetical protein